MQRAGGGRAKEPGRTDDDYPMHLATVSVSVTLNPEGVDAASSYDTNSRKRTPRGRCLPENWALFQRRFGAGNWSNAAPLWPMTAA